MPTVLASVQSAWLKLLFRFWQRFAPAGWQAVSAA